MAWDVVDFVFFSAILAGVSVIYILVARNADNTAYRIAVGLALAATLLLIWMNGAVGIIGDEGNDANMMYFGVLAVGGTGAIIARFQPQGTALAMYATAFAQVLVATIALIFGLGSTGPTWPWDILILNGCFAALWVGSAWLFQYAAREQPPAGGGPRETLD